MVPKGHPLVWNQADPEWLPHDVDEIRDLQMAYIDDCMTRFRGLIEVFDVVNEATHFDRARFVQRAPKTSAMWQKFGRIEFTRQCFQLARRGNHAASLLINDYRVDPAYKSLIEKLVDDDGERLYDVIGIQSHMHEGVWSTAKVWEVCERFATFGVPLHFTEMTIIPRANWVSDWPGREKGPGPQHQIGKPFRLVRWNAFIACCFHTQRWKRSAGGISVTVVPGKKHPEDLFEWT